MHELEVALPDLKPEELGPDGLGETFVAAYTSRFHHPPLDRPVRGVTWRLRASVEEASSRYATPPPVADGSVADVRTRELFLPQGRRRQDVAAYNRGALPPAFRGHGPALIEERTTTVVILSEAEFRVGDDLSLVVMLASH